MKLNHHPEMPLGKRDRKAVEGVGGVGEVAEEVGEGEVVEAGWGGGGEGVGRGRGRGW